MKRGKRIMLWILGIICLLILSIVILFNIHYSPTKSEFAKSAADQIAKAKPAQGVFTENDIAGLPSPLQKYFRYCGYIGKPQMAIMKAYYNDVDFVLSPDKPKLKIKYTQYNFVGKPDRIALIDTSMYGIPFEGIDAYQSGAGSMKGVIAKFYTLFDQKGEALDKSGLVTCLAESLLVPNVALQDFVKWEAIDDMHAKATITYYGISVSGIFTFDENGLLKDFTTDDRENVDTNGKAQNVKWSAVCEDYKDVNGIKYPSVLKAVWHYKTGDLVYFDGRDISIQYNVTK